MRRLYEAAAEEPGFPDGFSEEALFEAGAFSAEEELDEPSEEGVLSLEVPDSVDDPVPSLDEPEASAVVDFVSFDELDSLAAGRLSFL